MLLQYSFCQARGCYLPKRNATPTFEEPLGVLVVEREQLSGRFTDLGERVLDSPHLALVPQPVLADELELLVETLLLERTSGRNVRFTVHRRDATHGLTCAQMDTASAKIKHECLTRAIDYIGGDARAHEARRKQGDGTATALLRVP